MADLADCLGLRAAIRSAGFSDAIGFEAVYDEIATTGAHLSLKDEIESRVRSYFESLVLPEEPTLYDYLLLSLRETDLVATFNWDPFLAQAFMRNRGVAGLPRLAFLHGNVGIGVCNKDRVTDFQGSNCGKCGGPMQITTLLYPVRNKDYTSDPFIANEWAILKDSLAKAYMITIFGYSAPTTDAAAVELMSGSWASNPTFELGQVSIVDIKPEAELESTWQPFFCRSHYGIHQTIWTTWILRHPRRSCEALAMATLQNAPWPDNSFPQLKSLGELHDWIAPLVTEEKAGMFGGNPRPKTPSAIQIDSRKASSALDWVHDWLRLMCKAEVIPPLCVELVLKDGTRYYLHSIMRFEDESATILARIWDFRALNASDIEDLKETLNQVRSRADLTPAATLHPKLDWANLHLHYSDIAYCVEWHDRIWPAKEAGAAPPGTIGA